MKEVLYTISRRHMEYKKGRKVGWTVLADPSDCDGTDLYCLEPFRINKDTLIYLINNTEHPTVKNVHIIFRNGNSDAYEIK